MSSTSPLKDIWTTTNSDNWTSSRNWSLGRQPVKGELVEIEPASPITVRFDRGNIRLGGLRLTGVTLGQSSGSIIIDGAASFSQAQIIGPVWIVLLGDTTLGGLTLGNGLWLTNAGALVQSRGDLLFASYSATAKNNVGATWTIADASGMQETEDTYSKFINAGVFQKTSGSGTSKIAVDWFLSSGVVSVAAGSGIEFSRGLARLAGRLAGGGEISVGSNGVAALTNLDVSGATKLTNRGRVRILGDVTLHEGSTFLNDTRAVLNFASDGSLRRAPGESSAPTLVSKGKIVKSDGNPQPWVEGSVVELDADISGPVQIDTGVLKFVGSHSIFRGAVTGQGAFWLSGGNVEFGPKATVSARLWYAIETKISLGGDLVFNKLFGSRDTTFQLNGHNFILDKYSDSSSLGISLIYGAKITTSGAMIVASSVYGYLDIGGSVDFVVRGYFAQAGEVLLGADAFQAATITIENGGRWQMNEYSTIVVGPGNGSMMRIGDGDSSLGLLECYTLDYFGKAVVEAPIANNSTNALIDGALHYEGIEVSHGTLALKGQVSGVGTDNIVYGTLEFGGAVSEGQNVQFHERGGTLRLLDPTEFLGSVTGYHAGGTDDSIEIAGVWNLESTLATNTDAVLHLSGDGGAFDLHLRGDYYGINIGTHTVTDYAGQTFTVVDGWRLG